MSAVGYALIGRAESVDECPTISGIAADGLCTGCGTCAAFCPAGAIRMEVSDGIFLPSVEAEKCTQCGRCLQVCPGFAVDFQALSARVFEAQSADVDLGSYRRCVLAHSTNDEIRDRSASGGLVTQLLVFALESGLIDGALVVRMNRENPLEPESFIARTRDEIVDSSRSKYCPVSANEALRGVDGLSRLAVVGLPCHIHGVRKAEEAVKGLRDRVVLTVGLFCSHTVSFRGTGFLLRKLGVRADQVLRIDYRGSGWPGALSIQLKSGSTLRVPYVGGWNSYWPIFSSFFFAHPRCLMCPDETGELADLSCGDAWLPELKGDKAGQSIVVVRSKRGEQVLRQAQAAGAIRLVDISPEHVKRSQRDPLKFKKDDLNVRFALLQRRGRRTPVFTRKNGSPRSVLSWLRSCLVLLNVWAAENPRWQRFLVAVPLPLFRLYYGLYKTLSIR